MKKHRRKSLEERVTRISGISAWQNSERDNPFTSRIQQQISLTFEQLQRWQDLHKKQLRHLLRTECYVITDLREIQQQLRLYPPMHLWEEKDKLKRRLFEIEKERQGLYRQMEEKSQNLEGKLLELLHKYDELNFR